MSRWGSYFRIGVAAVVSFITENWSILAQQVAAEEGRRKRDSNNRRARREFNEAQKDRLQMVDLLPDQARTLCLGRVRYVEGVRRRWSSGVHSEIATFIVSVAGHEIDNNGFEQWYLDDLPVTLDAEGWVQEFPYGRTVDEPRSASGTADPAGGASIVLTGPVTAGSVTAVWTAGTGDSQSNGTVSVSLVGTTAIVGGVPPGAAVEVFYRAQVTLKAVRIRPFYGTDGQNIGAWLAAEYPGKISADDRLAGIAGFVVDFHYQPDAFPTSFPQVAPLFRAAKCFDPRTGLTVWTENPALHALRYAEWQHGWALRPQDRNLADVIMAANVCDESVGYTLTATGGGTSTVTLPRYRCGVTIGSDADHRASMNAILQTMAGADGWAGGVWRFRAGHVRTAVKTIDDSWYYCNVDDQGMPEDESVFSAVHALPREQRINRVGGRCVDPAQRYQLLPYPAVRDAVLIAAKGERPAEVDMPGVNHIAHAQHLASIAIRQAQAGLRVQMRCGIQAVELELFDVVLLNHARSGIVNKPMEVVQWGWQPGEPITLGLAEISADIFTPQSPLTGRDPAPDSTLRRPWDVEALGALTVTSGTAAVTDNGSVISRLRVQWPPVVGDNVRQGGTIELQYHDLSRPLPAGDWPSWTERGNATETMIPGVLGGRFYWVKGRCVQTLPAVNGLWTTPVLVQAASVRARNVYRQTSAPTTGVQDGDEWYDTDDGNRHFVREAGTWVDVRDGGIALALAAADDAQATADGKVQTFWQATPPGAAGEGDIWFDTDDGNKQYRYTSGAWAPAADTRIGTAISAAADAQATADGKVTTFVAASPPTAEGLGDLWLDTDDGNKLYRWNGTAWAALPVGTGGIQPGAATEVGAAYDAGPITRSNIV